MSEPCECLECRIRVFLIEESGKMSIPDLLVVLGVITTDLLVALEDDDAQAFCEMLMLSRQDEIQKMGKLGRMTVRGHA